METFGDEIVEIKEKKKKGGTKKLVNRKTPNRENRKMPNEKPMAIKNFENTIKNFENKIKNAERLIKEKKDKVEN